MKSSLIRPLSGVIALAALGLAAACNNQPPAATTPTQQPTIGGSAAPTASGAPAATPGASTPLPEGADFVEEFSGPTLDEAKWQLVKQAGLTLFEDGRLQMLSAGTKPTFPFLATRDVIIPQDGPFFFELKYQYLSNGAPVSFNLDYYPPEQPNMDGLTIPLMRTMPVATAMRMIFHTETGEPFVDTGLDAYLSTTGPHTMRVEFDGTETYRVLFDNVERGTVTSKRRPRKFWVGNYPNRTTAGQSWPHIALDYLKAGVLAAPAVASSPSPKP